ncbi:unnamed protein product [Calypogeia fissa]
MADSAGATTGLPWYETLKGIAKGPPDPELMKSRSKSRSNNNAAANRRVSPTESPVNTNDNNNHNNIVDVEALSGDQARNSNVSENFSTDRSSLSSFSFSRRLRVVIPPDPPEESHFKLEDHGAVTPPKNGAVTPKNMKELRSSSSKESRISSGTKETSSVMKERSSSPREGSSMMKDSRGAPLPAQNQGGFQPVPLPLPPPPAAVASPTISSKQGALEYPRIRDFEYHPRPQDRYYDPPHKDEIEPPPKQSRRWNCFCWFCTIILCLVLSLGIAVAVLATMTNPKSPSLEIGDVGVTSLNFTAVGNTGGQVKTAMHFSFNLTNPNKCAQVVYSPMFATVSYKQVLLNNVTIAGFTQARRRSTNLSAEFPQRVTIVPGDTVGALKGDVAGNDVQIVLRCSATGRFKIFGFKVKRFSVPVYCQFGVKPGDVGLPPVVLEHSCYYQ